MANMLTEKELELISDLLKAEEIACKKAALYSRTISDTEAAKRFSEIKDSHEKKFKILFDML